jgi:hypothetical protein
MIELPLMHGVLERARPMIPVLTFSYPAHSRKTVKQEKKRTRLLLSLVNTVKEDAKENFPTARRMIGVLTPSGESAFKKMAGTGTLGDQEGKHVRTNLKKSNKEENANTD